MTGFTVNVAWQRRRAEVTQNVQQATFNKLEVGTHPCHVLGLYQVADEDDVQPYFVCEMDDGRTIYAKPTQVRFLDTTELNSEEVSE